MSGLPCDWNALSVEQAQGSRVAGLPRDGRANRPHIRREPREAAVLWASRVLVRALGIHHTTAKRAALALDNNNLLSYPRVDG